jgi:xanthine/CO dehydrogenase XdhC/CoxF family maturation factor
MATASLARDRAAFAPPVARLRRVPGPSLREWGMRSGRLEVRLDTSLESLLGKVPQNGGPGVLATVVATAGSTYRKPGARMLILSDGSYFGLLSGGCLEADLAIHAREVLRGGTPRAVEYDMRGPDDILFGIGAGCEGAMRVLLEPAGPGSPAATALANAGRATRAGRSTSLIMVHDSTDLVLGTHDAAALSEVTAPAQRLSPALLHAAQRALADAESRGIDTESAGRRTRAFVQFLAPPPHILICGAGPDAQPVAAAALALDWRVTVVDHRPAYALAERFPGATVQRGDARSLRSSVALQECHAAVVMSHHLHSDVAYLRELAEAGVPDYVGLLGPAARRRRIAEELAAVSEKLHSRLRGPVGFDIGAVTPQGIALAIISEIHAWLAGVKPMMPDASR